MKSPVYKVFIKNTQRDISNLVESFRYERCLDADNYVEMDFWTGNAFSTIDDDDLVSGTILQFQYGYLGQEMSSVNEIRITDVDTEYGDRVKFKVKGLDLGNVMKKGSEQTVWKNKTSSQIAEEIAAKYGLTPIIQPTTYVWVSLPQANKSDFDLLKELAAKEANGEYQFHIQSNKLHFEKKDFDKSASAKYTYGTDIIRFTPKLKEAKQTGAANSVKAVGVDALSKNTISTEDTNTGTLLGSNPMKLVVGDLPSQNLNENSKTTNKGTKYDWDGNPLKNGSSEQTPVTAKKVIAIPNSSNTEAQNISNGIKKRNNEKILEGTLVIEGNPLLKLSDILTISNVALKHAGNWKIEKISDSITVSGGYITTVTLSKNGTIKPVNKDVTPTDSTIKVNKTDGKGKGNDTKTLTYYNWDGDKKNK